MPVFFEINSRVINGHPIANGGCPLYPQKQTRSSSASLSAKCHERKSRHELLLSDRNFTSATVIGRTPLKTSGHKVLPEPILHNRFMRRSGSLTRSGVRASLRAVQRT